MRVSLNVTDFGTGDTVWLAEIARAADNAGFDTLWIPDHLLQFDPTADSRGPMFEAYTTLGFLAAHTRRIRLGTMVTAATYRPAALLIKAVTTLDVLSGGRAWLGIGAGYQTAEAVAVDLPLPSTRERFEYLEDTVRLATHMWANQPTRFDGIHVHPHNAVGHPGPVTRPHPPILIGGTGEQRTLRLVAQHADACNLFDVPDGGATLRHKLAVLDRHCTEVGRPPDAVRRTVSTRLRHRRPRRTLILERHRHRLPHRVTGAP
jgi:F420-dependent oxidoreductase-like protein